MPEEDAYADIVTLYDIEHDDFTDDIEFLLEVAQLGEGPILELGCGTGRVLLPLAAAGYNVVGIDSSQAMLKVAHDRLGSGLEARLLTGDMADLNGIEDGPFGLIIASLNSTMHLTTQDRQRSMITSAWRALAPGGRLVIDTLNPSISQLNHLLNTTHLEGTWVTEDGTTIDKWGYRQPGGDPQIIDTLIWYDHTSANGDYHRTRTRFELRYIYQSELALLLELAGYTRVDWYGNYDLDAWEPEAERIIAIAHKDDE